jgi:hypothetical protein
MTDILEADEYTVSFVSSNFDDENRATAKQDEIGKIGLEESKDRRSGSLMEFD